MFFIISNKFFIILKEFWHEWFMLLFVNNPLRLFGNNPLWISPKGVKLCHTLILEIFCNNQTTKLTIVQLRDKVEEIKKNIRTWDGDVSFPSYNTLKRGFTIFIFYKTNILSKTFMPNCGQCWRETFPHRYA